MSPAAPSPARLHRTARAARWLVLAGALLFSLNALATWLFANYASHIIESQTNVTLLAPLTPATRVAYVLWDIPSLAVILAALLRLWQLFGEYLHARVFGPRALASLRGFARWVVAAALWSPVYRAVLSEIATWQNGPGRREFNLNLYSSDYLVLLLGVALLAISGAMVEAARIAQDNEGFV